MKLINTFLKFIAVIILIFFIILFPISLVINSVSHFISDPEKIANIIEKNIINVDFIAEFIEDTIISDMDIPNDGSPIALIQESVFLSSHENIVEIINLVLPQNQLSKLVNGITDNLYANLVDGNSVDMVIELNTVKRNLLKNNIRITNILLKSLPQCSPEQLQLFINLDISNVEEISIPSCRPPEPFYSLFLDGVAEYMPAMLENLPSQYVLPINSIIGNLPFSDNMIRTGLKLGNNLWKVGLGMLFMAVIFAARSISQIFKWAGLPLLLSGLLTFGIGKILVDPNPTFLLDISNEFTQEFGVAAGAQIGNMLLVTIGAIFNPMVWQGTLQMLIGVGAIILSIILWMLFEKAKTEVENIETAASTEPAIISPNIQEDENKDTPSGMFG
jgi:hypothetical protein